MAVEYVNYTWKPTNATTSRVFTTEDMFNIPQTVSSTQDSSAEQSKESKESKNTSRFQGWSSSGIDTSYELPYSLTTTQVQYYQDNSSQPIQTTKSSGKSYSRGNLRAEILNLFEKELGWKHDKDFHLGEAIRSKDSKIGSKTSHHHSGNAVDLTPRGNMTFLQMRVMMLTNPNIRKFFSDNGLGIIDESTEALRKSHSWKSTGNHYHIGPDRLAVSTWNDWSRQAGYVKKGGVIKAASGIKFNSYKALDKPHTSLADAIDPIKNLYSSIEIPVYNPTATQEQVVEQADLQTKADNIRNRFQGWKSSGIENKEHSSSKIENVPVQNTKQNTKQQNFSTENMSEFSNSFLDRITHQESRNNPKAVGPKTKSGDQAYGLYQIMWSNVKKYSRYSKNEFLEDPIEQRRVAELVAREQWNQLTEQDKQLAAKKGLTRDQMQAAMWFSGVGGFRKFIAGTKDSSDGYKKVSQYINDLT